MARKINCNKNTLFLLQKLVGGELGGIGKVRYLALPVTWSPADGGNQVCEKSRKFLVQERTGRWQ